MQERFFFLPETFCLARINIMTERITIPDDDVSGWMQTLREGGFSEKEIDEILSHLNTTYLGFKNKEFVDGEYKKMNEEIKSKRGTGFTPAEEESIRKGIQSRLR